MLAQSERQQVKALHGLPTSARDASKPLQKPPFYSFNNTRKRKRMASSDEVEVQEVPPPSRQWNSAPTVIPPPARMRAQHAAPVANRNARYATNNRAVLSTSPVTPAVPAWRKDGPSAKIQRLDGTADVSHARRKENGNNKEKEKEVIVLDDEPDEKRPMHAMLDVEYKAPFSPDKDKPVKKRSAEDSDPIESYTDIDDDDGLIVLPPGQEFSVPVASSDKDTRRITPTRFAAPEGSVKQKVQAYETLGQSGSKPPPDHDFSAPTANGKKLSKRERMKGKQAESAQSRTEAVMAQLMAGSDPSEKSLSSRTRYGGAMGGTSRPTRAAQSVLRKSTTLSSRNAKPEPIVSADEAEKRQRRTERFAQHPPSEASNSTRQTRASTAPKVFGPIPLTAFCLGQERWHKSDDEDEGEPDAKADDEVAPDAYLKVTADALEVYRDAACSRKAADPFRKGDIDKVEITERRFQAAGGIKFTLKKNVDTFDSSLFFSDDEGPMGWIILRFASFKEPGWTLTQQDELFEHIPVFLGRKPDYIAPAVLDSCVEHACIQAAAHQQANLLDPPPPSSAKRRASGKQTEDIRRHFLPKDKDKEVSAGSFYSSRHAPWSGDSGEAGPSLRPRSTRSSSTYRVPASDESDDPIDSLENMPPVLARKRPPSRQAQAKEKENLEEIILVWPRGGPGALNISLGDLRRLAPGEFLNDTIIEFGLKYWLHNLRATQSAIADDIHVFSSFFYKKLNQKNFEEGYQSVRKWTNKVDIFKKKYIIVPINEHIHWYLAIIYRPEYVLRPPRPKEEARRQSTRILAQHLQDDEVHAKSAASPTPGPSAEIVEVLDSDGKQEPEPDRVPMDVDADTDAMSVTGRLAHSSLDDTRSKIDPALLEHDGGAVAQEEAPEMVTDDEEPPMVDDAQPIVRERSISLGSGKPPVLVDSAMQSVLDSAEPTAAPTPATLDDEELVAEEMAEVEAEVEETNDPMKMSYIFTFDSLGARHPQAIKNLQKYLAAEAEDKRKIPRERTTVPDGKKAVVPTQPNYCDCGLYLLHFAETFIGEPEKFTRAILTPAKKLRDDKNALWQNHELSDKRNALTGVIETLSEVWKEEKRAEEQERERAKAQEQDKAHEDTDDEIICEEPVVVPKKPTIKAGKVASRK